MRLILTIVRNVKDRDLESLSFDKFEEFLVLKANILTQRDLCANIAKEYEIEKKEENLFEIISEYLQGKNTDFFLRSKEQHLVKKKLYITDMDSTLIKNECIDEMAEFIGKGDEIKNITKASMEGNLIFESSLEHRVNLLKGMSVKLLNDIYENVIELSEGAEIVARTLKKNDVKLAIVSGGFTYFTGQLREKLNFDYDFANNLEVKDGKLTGRLVPPIFGSADKLVALKDIMREMNIHEDEVIGIGDGANDLIFLSHIQNGFAYKAKPLVQEKLKLHINHTDLTSVLYFLGFSKNEFA